MLHTPGASPVASAWHAPASHGLPALIARPPRMRMSAAAAAQPTPASTSSFERCANPDLAAAARRSGLYDELGGWMGPNQVPIVYSHAYNIRFFGLEKLHPLDSAKYAKIVASLQERCLLQASQLVAPREASAAALREVHSERYLGALHSSRLEVARVVELPPLALFPMFLLQRYLLRPMRHHVGGTMLAAALALERGWSINLGGGMHHAYWDGGGGWCPYADISLALMRARAATGGALERVMVVDLDVHQGNGVERDKLHFGRELGELHVFDMYNSLIYPSDVHAKQGADTRVEYASGVQDEEYLTRLEGALGPAMESSRPQLVLYNAGTDVLQGDPLGRANITPEGVMRRDEIVFEAAQRCGAPVCMLLSGGYTRASAGVIANSIENLVGRFGLLTRAQHT